MGSARAFVAPRIRQAAPLVALLRDEEEAGYFYSDLAQLLGEDGVLFSPQPIAVLSAMGTVMSRAPSCAPWCSAP